MFDNLGTALVQALGFFTIFGFFVYQTLLVDKKPKKSQISKINKYEKKELNNGLFSRKIKPVQEDLTVKKRSLFSRKKEIVQDDNKPKKKGWFD